MTAATGMSVVYFLLGQAAWFACVVSAAHGTPGIGIIIVAILLAVHLSRVRQPRQECKFLLVVVVIGMVWESVLVRFDLLSYPGGMLMEGFAPAWIVAVWVLFGGQFNTTYRWLKRRPVAAALLGAVAGPLSFRAGALLGAVKFNRPLSAILALTIGWAIILPLLTLVSRRWDGVGVDPSS
jgi:hypothetical protein